MLGLLAPLGVPAKAVGLKPFDHAALARTALERHIRPGYEKLSEAAGILLDAASRQCASGAPGELKTLQVPFGQLVTAWGRVEHIRFGPVAKDNRLERILFWPDRKGIGSRQIDKALETRDATVTDSRSLAGKSVALQGLGALDQILYQGDNPPRDVGAQTQRCQFAKAIAGNLATMSQAMVAEWRDPEGFSRTWLSAGAGNPQYMQPSETTRELARALDNGIERVRDERIAGPLGLTKLRRRLPVVLGASGSTTRLVIANIDGLLDLYETGGMREAILATRIDADEHEIAPLAELTLRELATARSSLRKVESVRDPFNDANAKSILISVGFPLKNARTQADQLLATTAQITQSFNASDGD